MGRLKWNRRVERDRAVLERILALLLALAALVDRAAGLPAVNRLQLLATLGRGEAEARRLIVAMASNSCPAAPADAAAAPPPTVGDAGQLAASFRMLALALYAMLTQVRGRSPRRYASLARLPGRKLCRPEGGQAFPALLVPDTS